jgi:adenine phosphoribosyltransferase
MSQTEALLKSRIRDVPDFPKPGILFKDITPALQDPACLKAIIAGLAQAWADKDIDTIVGVESRGFIFASALACEMNKGLALVRKPGKLPWKTVQVSYGLEYGTDTLQIHEDAVQAGARVLVVDDVLATGGTAEATCRLVEQVGGQVAGCAFVIELSFLEGRARLGSYPVQSLLTY